MDTGAKFIVISHRHRAESMCRDKHVNLIGWIKSIRVLKIQLEYAWG
jgi:hypothetical protein